MIGIGIKKYREGTDGSHGKDQEKELLVHGSATPSVTIHRIWHHHNDVTSTLNIFAAFMLASSSRYAVVMTNDETSSSTERV
jgi:hypothetical protein